MEDTEDSIDKVSEAGGCGGFHVDVEFPLVDLSTFRSDKWNGVKSRCSSRRDKLSSSPSSSLKLSSKLENDVRGWSSKSALFSKTPFDDDDNCRFSCRVFSQDVQQTTFSPSKSDRQGEQQLWTTEQVSTVNDLSSYSSTLSQREPPFKFRPNDLLKFKN